MTNSEHNSPKLTNQGHGRWSPVVGFHLFLLWGLVICVVLLELRQSAFLARVDNPRLHSLTPPLINTATDLGPPLLP